MAAPNTPVSEQGGGITFDEMETQLKDAERQALKPDLGKIVLEGDDLPADLKGKSAADALTKVRQLEEALRLSEQARQQALVLAQTASSKGAEAAPQVREPEPEPQITPEQVAEAFQDDPAKGITLMQKMNEQAMQRTAAQFMSRIDPLVSGTVSAVEAEARRKYPDEFEIYKDEIAATLGQVKNKNVMSAMESWDDLIAFVRGKDPTKLFTRMQEKERSKQQQDAQEFQRQAVGPSLSGPRSPGPVNRGVIIDDTVREICRIQGISEEDYVKWANVR